MTPKGIVWRKTDEQGVKSWSYSNSNSNDIFNPDPKTATYPSEKCASNGCQKR